MITFRSHFNSSPTQSLMGLLGDIFHDPIGHNLLHTSGSQCVRGRGVQGQKSWKHDFEITGDPKGPPSGSTFWSCFEAPDSKGYHYLLTPIDR